jgi:hypothetical protein
MDLCSIYYYINTTTTWNQGKKVYGHIFRQAELIAQQEELKDNLKMAAQNITGHWIHA